jgi:hypothetical protein
MVHDQVVSNVPLRATVKAHAHTTAKEASLTAISAASVERTGAEVVEVEDISHG